MRDAVLRFLIAWLAALAAGNAVIQPLTYTNFSQPLRNAYTPQIAVPFGTRNKVRFSEPLFIQTTELQFDINNVASDEQWNRYKAKGVWYGCLLDMTIEKAGKALNDPGIPPSVESVWQGDFRDNILSWGWHEASYDPKVNCDFRDDPTVDSKNKIGTALSSLGLSQLPLGAGGDNECFSIEHFDESLVDEDGEEVPIEDQEYQINNHIYPCTGAYYRFAMNKKGGAIFAQNLQKPEAAAMENLAEDIPEDQLPHLSRASDIMYAYWAYNNPDPKKIYNYFVNHVVNDETIPLVARALRNHNLDHVPYWPGLHLKMHQDEAEAILGSPMGSTIAHFLLQHKKTLGIKNFEGITIFRDNYPASAGTQEVHLLFKIIDVPPDEVDDSDDEEMPDMDGVMARRAGSRKDEDERGIVREHRIVSGWMVSEAVYGEG